MKKELVDSFNGLHCCRCKKSLENEKQVVYNEDLCGHYLCLDCFYKRKKEIMFSNRNLL